MRVYVLAVIPLAVACVRQPDGEDTAYEDPAEGCRASGGTPGVVLCCNSDGALFPDTCDVNMRDIPGYCAFQNGCGPSDAYQVEGCVCPEGSCFQTHTNTCVVPFGEV